MPIWQLFVPEGAYSASEKREMSNDITAIYSEGAGLPRFYVNVVFHELAEENFLIAGEPRSDFVRVVIDHIARRFEDLPNHMELPEGADLPALWRDIVATVLKPYVADRGYHWELHTDETPVEYWYIDGLTPPPGWSETEREWADAGYAFDYSQGAAAS
jgi:phenylpyruvate tautomerase PptA (4-oxalocrotonate tautomerase family)